MKKIVLLAGILVMLATTSANAQVTIGAKQDPQNYSALEIISNGSNGLRLPQLTTTQRNDITASGKMLAEGLMIYNIETKCVDYWNGSKWMNLCVGSLDKDASGNYKLTGKICFDVWRGNDNTNGCAPLSVRTDDFASSKSFAYTFSSPTGLTYSALNFWISDENGLVATTNTASNVFTVTFKDNIASLVAGTDKTTAKKLIIVAQYKDNTNAEKQVTLTVSVQDCGCGCSVKSGPSTWLTFMCHNLGANETMSIAEQMAYASPTGNPITDPDSVVYGNLYQWGRKSDGYESRNSPIYPTTGPVSISDLNSGQAPDAAKGKFIKCPTSSPWDWRTPQVDTLWHSPTIPKKSNDPCPDGWRVPTNGEWNSITTSINSSNINTSWVDAGSGNKVHWNESSNTHGLEISTDNGATTALFLPAAGYRAYNAGSLYLVGTRAYYWSSSSSTDNTRAHCLYFFSGNVHPVENFYRAYGMSVRCVAE